ncbi:uncharacterized protein LOC141852160 [Brevipalpus obovatus]|uniref:uncharacterized protein LOC141852160 n=1 Tax=Brevipalpus obovatus TaxID=246614 RepID=UPI003D9F5DC7
MNPLNRLCMFTALCFGDFSHYYHGDSRANCRLYNAEDGLSLDENRINFGGSPACLSYPHKLHSLLLRNLRTYEPLIMDPSKRWPEFQHLMIHNCELIYEVSQSFEPSKTVTNLYPSLLIDSSVNILSWLWTRLRFQHIYIEKTIFGFSSRTALERQKRMEMIFIHPDLISLAVIDCPNSLDSLGFLDHATGLKVLRIKNSFTLSNGEKSLTLPSLQILSLRDNGISSIPISFVDQLCCLKELDLSGNSILEIDAKYQFKPFWKQLKDLNLPDNCNDCTSFCRAICEYGGLTRTMFSPKNECLMSAAFRKECISKCPAFGRKFTSFS